jgi:hypothetical protein
MDAVREYLGITADGHESYSHTGSQWRLKITRAADVVTIRNLLERHEWAPRKSRERPYPSGPLNDMGFVRAWLELHSSADVVRTGRKRMPTPRLRVYGSQPLMEELNRVVTAGMGLPPRKLQRVTTGTGETWCLYYFGGSFRAVVDWLYAGIELFNPTTRNRFEEVLQPVDGISLAASALFGYSTTTTIPAQTPCGEPGQGRNPQTSWRDHNTLRFP